MSKTTATAETLQLECAPWCESQDPMLAGEPGYCLSVELRTPLSIPQSKPDDLPDGVADYACVHAFRRPGDPAMVVLAHGEQVGTDMTPDEARQLVENIQLLLGQIEAGR